MISVEERRYLHWLASTQWRGRGHVVEMGPWLGGSTVCLADGMAENPARGSRELHAFDSFVWREFMADKYPLPIAPGESFERFFLENMAMHSGFVRTHASLLPDEEVSGDIMAQAVRDGASRNLPPVAWAKVMPIEILFVDGAKSWTGLVSLLRTFGPALIDGARVAFQDYKWWGAFWVPAIAEYLQDHLEIEHILENNTVTFRARGAIDLRTLLQVPTWDVLDAVECAGMLDDAAHRLASRGDLNGAAMVRLGVVRMWQQRGSTELAAEALREAQLTWPATTNDYPIVSARAWLEESSGGHYPPPVRARIRRRWARVTRRFGKR